jgi:hypothetical protein
MLLVTPQAQRRIIDFGRRDAAYYPSVAIAARALPLLGGILAVTG